MQRGKKQHFGSGTYQGQAVNDCNNAIKSYKVTKLKHVRIISTNTPYFILEI